MKIDLNNKKTQKNAKTRMAVNNTAKKKSDKHQKKNNILVELFIKIIIVIVIMVVAAVLISVSGAVNITEIIVENNKNISSEQIISFSQIQKGTNLFAISKSDVMQKVKENSYVEDVQIKRVFPNKIKLIVVEREAEYMLQLANSYVYINKQGFVLEISNNKLNVPVIVGMTTDLTNIKPNDRLNDEDLQKMNTIIKIMETAKNNDMKELITKIDVANKNDYIIHLESEGKIAYLGGGQELNTRFLYIKSILKEQQGKSGEIFVNMDLNSEYVYFRENI